MALAPAANADKLDDWWLQITMSILRVIVTRWRSLALLTWWMLWKERNNRIFNNVAAHEAILVDKIISKLDHWRAAGVLRESWPAGD
jgi:hypothetical protein